ncbi:MAG: glycosyltransferase, partial [Actinomycetota bacterium]
GTGCAHAPEGPPISDPVVTRAAPRVAAVLVVHDGEAWLGGVLQALAQQDYPGLEVLVVDNASTDGSSALLERRVPAQRRLRTGRNTGFGRAVHAAMRQPMVAEADYVLLLHDDLLLAPDAVSRLVAALEEDPTCAVVGPKLREWREEATLQQAGMTIDRLGRAESGVDRGELDQGQADVDRDVLYVSTAGMLLRADVFRELRGFDARMPAMRDDLDYCWRAWLAGWRVRVVPEAVGYHAAAGGRGQRALWSPRSAQPRYLAERHTLATQLKCAGGLRLAWLVPLLLVVGLGKTIAFSLVRRFAEAGATLRAYAWNLQQLPRTLRLRRGVQRRRVRSERELAALLAPGLPRLAEYWSAARDRLSSSETPSILTEEGPVAAPVGDDGPALLRFARRHPAAALGALLAVAYLIGLVPLLGAGQLAGGQVAAWPAEATALLRAYASPLAGEALPGAVAASPIQALLGGLALLGGGSAWLAQRLVVLGLLPVAWLAAVRAGLLVTSRSGPRALGATLYVLSPPVLGTLAAGRLAELFVAAVLPAIVLLTARAAGPGTARDRAWRATALLGLLVAVAVAASPGVGGALVALTLLGGLAAALWPGAERVGYPLLRLAVAVVGAAVILLPWLWSVATTPGADLVTAPVVELPAWRALALVPEVVPSAVGVTGIVTIALAVAVVALALLLGLRLRPLPVAALAAALVATAAAAWGAAQAGASPLWAPGLLLGGSLALGGLAVVAARTVGPALRSRAFGLAQLTVVVGALVLVGGLGLGIAGLAASPWDGLEREAELLPPFVAADEERLGSYRVLLVDVADDALEWEVIGPDGPSILGFGTIPGPEVTGFLEDGLAEMAAGDPDAGAALGAASVRYVVLTGEARTELDEALLRQADLEPLATGAGRVLVNRAWLPRAAFLPGEPAERIIEPGSPGDLTAWEEAGLRSTGVDRYEGVAGGDGLLLLAEAGDPWEARTRDGGALERVEGDRALPAAFALPEEATLITLEPAFDAEHAAGVGAQAAAALILLSLLLRPPGFAQARQPQAPVAEPADLVAAGALKVTEPIVLPPDDVPAPDETVAPPEYAELAETDAPPPPGSEASPAADDAERDGADDESGVADVERDEADDEPGVADAEPDVAERDGSGDVEPEVGDAEPDVAERDGSDDVEPEVGDAEPDAAEPAEPERD